MLGLVCRVAGPASSVGVERREREGPREDCGRSRSGKPGLAGQEGGREQKKRNNEDKKRYAHYGWNSPPVSSET